MFDRANWKGEIHRSLFRRIAIEYKIFAVCLLAKDNDSELSRAALPNRCRFIRIGSNRNSEMKCYCSAEELKVCERNTSS